MLSFIRFCLSLPFFTLTILLGHSFFKLSYNFSTPVALPLFISFSIALLFFSFICKFLPFYVFGHELAHWIFAKIFLKETKNFNVGQNKGMVEVKNPNIFITLAPYFYPTYSVLWLPFWLLAKHFETTFPHSITIFFCILAVTWAYHLVLTTYSLTFTQPDLLIYGKPLSLSIIFFINTAMMYFFLSWLTSDLANGFKILWHTSTHDLQFLYLKLKSCFFW